MSKSDRVTPPSIDVALAGGITLVGWGTLAWRSHGEGAMLSGMLVTLAVAWAALAWAMTHASLRDSSRILVFGIGFRIISLTAQPVMEDDHFRFLWDGFRFAVTGDPYAEAPQARFADETIPEEFRALLDRINYPDVPTVYGPLTQWAFRLAYAIAPAQLWPWKLILFGAELALFAMLWPVLGARGRLLLAWCPLAVFETGFNAHPDVLAIALLVASWWLGKKKYPQAAGVAAGFAVATKVFAVPLVPFLLWRRGWRAWAWATGALVALYAPFWLRGSTADLTGLRAMAGEWEFNSSVHALVAALSSPAVARLLCAGAFALCWLVIFRRWARARSLALPPGEWVFGIFLLLSATANPWYALWLWPFVAVRNSATGITALAAVSLAYVTGLNLGAASLAYFAHPWWLRPLEFGLIGLAALHDARRHRTFHFFFFGGGKRWFT